MKLLAIGGPLNGQFFKLSERSVMLTISTEKETFVYEVVNSAQGNVLMLKAGEA